MELDMLSTLIHMLSHLLSNLRNTVVWEYWLEPASSKQSANIFFSAGSEVSVLKAVGNGEQVKYQGALLLQHVEGTKVLAPTEREGTRNVQHV